MPGRGKGSGSGLSECRQNSDGRVGRTESRMGVWVRIGLLFWALAGALTPWALSQSNRFSQLWPKDRSDFASDSRVRWGTLENGFRYAILPDGNPYGAVSLRFAVNVGSLRESEKESGFAHLIEHLAFEGAGEFSASDIESLFLRWGLSLGSDVNGYTTHHYTCYQIDLKSDADSYLESAFSLYRAFADGIRFDAESIEKQRSIVLAEKLQYEQPLAQFSAFALERTLKGSKYGERPIVGDEAALNLATRDRLMKFYRNWYRPEMMTLFVVGDVDRLEVERLVNRHFGSLQSRGRASPPDVGNVEENQIPRVGLTRIPGMDRTLIDLSRSWQEPRGRDSERLRQRDFLRRFACELLNERCQRFVGVFDSDFVFYETRLEATYAHARLTTSPEKWRTGVAFLDRMIRQASRHGFHPEEIESLKKRWNRRIAKERAAGLRADSHSLAVRLEEATMLGKVYLSSDDEYVLYRRFLDDLNKFDLDRAMREMWRTTGVSLAIGGEIPESVTPRSLGREFLSYRRLSIEPYDYPGQNAIEWAWNGRVGGIASERGVPLLDETYRFVFENQTSLTTMRTRNEPGFVQILVRLRPDSSRDGSLLNPAIRSVALDSFLWSGVSGFQWESIHRELSSRVLDFEYAIEGEDCLCFRARCEPVEIDWVLGMIATFLEKGTVSERGFAFAKSNMMRSLQVELDGMALAKQSVQRELFPGRPELWDPDFKDGLELDREAVAGWLGEILNRSSIEVTVVGDADKDRVAKIVGMSLGALDRPARPERTEAERFSIEFDAGLEKLPYPKQQGERALAIGNWILEPGPTTHEERLALVVCERILKSRLDTALRKDRALSYTTKVDYWALPAFQGFQRFRVEADCRARDLDEVLAVVERVWRNLASGESPISSDELDGARRGLEAEFDFGFRDNRYILENILYSLDERPEWVEEWNALNSGALERVSAEDVVSVCRSWLSWDQALVRGLQPELATLSLR